MFTKIKFCILALLCTVMLSFAASAPKDIVDASYEITGEVHLKSQDTLLKTNDTIKFMVPSVKYLTGVDWTLMTYKIRPVNGTGDSIRAQLKLIAYDDSSHIIGEKILDTLTDSLSRPIRVPYHLLPASRYGLWALPIAATFGNGIYIQRSKLIYGRPVLR